MSCGSTDNFSTEKDQVTDPIPVPDTFEVFSITEPDDNYINPDFSKLEIAISENIVMITLELKYSYEIKEGDIHIYLYGDNNDMIRILPNHFSLNWDSDENGHFETFVTEGNYTEISPGVYQIEIAKEYLDDIYTKEIWAYSMTSTDRIPDTGRLIIEQQLQTNISNP